MHLIVIGHTTTMICSMRLDGSTACMTVEGATDTEFSGLTCGKSCAQHYEPAMWSSWTTFHRTKALPQTPRSKGLNAICLLVDVARRECQIFRKWLRLATQVRFALVQEWASLLGAAGSDPARSGKWSVRATRNAL